MSEQNCFTCVCCNYWGPESSFNTLKLSSGVEVHCCSMCGDIYRDWHCEICGIYIPLSTKTNYVLRPSGEKVCLKCGNELALDHSNVLYCPAF